MSFRFFRPSFFRRSFSVSSRYAIPAARFSSISSPDVYPSPRSISETNEVVIDNSHHSPSRIVCIAVDESTYAQHGISHQSLILSLSLVSWQSAWPWIWSSCSSKCPSSYDPFSCYGRRISRSRSLHEDGDWIQDRFPCSDQEGSWRSKSITC